MLYLQVTYTTMSNISTMINEEVGITDPSAVDAFSNGTNSYRDFNDTNNEFSIYVRSPGYAYWMSNVIILVLGLAGNALVMVLMADVKFSTLSYPVYLKFSAISDSLVLLLIGFRESQRLFTSPALVATNSILCAFAWFALNTTMTTSPWLVVGLTLDRFFCVVFPLKRHLLCTRNIAVISCSCICVISIIMCLPLLFSSKLQTNKAMCVLEANILEFFAFLRLVFTSNFPCLLILIFNIVIGIHIQRSARFRKTFTNATSDSMKDKKDNSLRPLLLISMMAFLTIMPSSVAESVVAVLMKHKINPGTADTFLKLSLLLNIPYLINFAQNFYILMASSANYRDIMKVKLKFLTESRRTETVRMSVTAVQISDGMSI